MHTPTPSPRAKSIASRSVWRNPMSTRSPFVCSTRIDQSAVAASSSSAPTLRSPPPRVLPRQLTGRTV
jgi:hypothetical protein